jgi:hypothetical protein
MIISGVSCSKSPVLDCFKSTGKITQTERIVSDFHTIVLRDNIDLQLRQSDQNKLVLEAGNNLMSKIYTDVSNSGVLEIKNENRCNWVRSYDKPITVYLDFVKLDTLVYRSVGNVTNEDTIRADTLVVEVNEGAGRIELKVDTYKILTNLHYGTADITTSGKTVVSLVYLAGFGMIDNSQLIANHIYLNNKSSNDIFINAITTIEATIENIGDIYYLGNPGSVSVEKLGPGNLIKLED